MRSIIQQTLILIVISVCCLLKTSAQNSTPDLPAAVVQAISSYTAKPTQTNRESLKTAGFAFIRENKFEEAEAIFSAVLAKSPREALSLYGKAICLFNLNRSAEAEPFADAAVELLSIAKENNLLTADALVLSAIISAVKGQNQAAIEKLKRAIVLSPNNFDARFSLGRAFYGNGDTGNAIAAFQDAVKIQPSNGRAKFFLATALETSGDSPAALKIYRELVEIAPNVADGYLGLGSLLVKTEGAASAEGLQNLQKAVALNGNLYEARAMLGKTLLKLNRSAESIEQLQKAAALAPNNPEPHYQLVIAFRKAGKKAEAEAEQEIVKRIHETRRGVRAAEN